MKPRFVLSALVTLGIFFAIALFGRISVGSEVEHGVLRLAWRTSGQKVRICRELTETEKARTPVHMRRNAGCVTRNLPYRLRVQLDGQEVVNRPILPAGIHGDRPLYVQEDFALAPASRQVKIDFAPDLTLREDSTDGSQSAWEAAATGATQLHFDDTVAVKAGRVTFVTQAEADGPLLAQ